MAVAVAGFSPRRGRRTAPGHGREALGAAHDEAEEPLLLGHGRRTASTARRPTSSSTRWRPLRTSAFPSRTRSPSLTSSTARRGSRCTTRRAFLVSLLNAQPMGFWSTQSLVADAQRHGVRVCRPDVERSHVGASLEGAASTAPRAPRTRRRARRRRSELAERIVAGAPWADSADLVRRAGAQQHHLEALAAAGALDALVRRAARSPGRPARPHRRCPIDCLAW